METWVESLGEKRFRARQLWSWLYKRDKLAPHFDAMTDVSWRFREQLKRVARVDALGAHGVQQARDGTRKITYRLDNGGLIESVLIPADGRNTLCVSSQLGCALNCQFCFTGKMGLRANLSTAEIVDQVVQARRYFETSDGGNDDRDDDDSGSGGDDDVDDDGRRHHGGGNGGRISNVVFMGMGEPLHNCEHVLRAVRVLLDPHGLAFSHNKVTVSTSGLVPQIKRFVRECHATLAVSLNATTDETRNWIMPINRKYPLETLMHTLADAFPRPDRRQDKVFFEYVMLAGVNDSMDDARRILQLTAHVPCKVNLIEFNAHAGSEFRPSSPARMEQFREYLKTRGGMVVTIRRSRGDDEMAACGQLGKLRAGEAAAGEDGGGRVPPRMRVPAAFRQAIDMQAYEAWRERARGDAP